MTEREGEQGVFVIQDCVLTPFTNIAKFPPPAPIALYRPRGKRYVVCTRTCVHIATRSLRLHKVASVFHDVAETNGPRKSGKRNHILLQICLVNCTHNGEQKIVGKVWTAGDYKQQE